MVDTADTQYLCPVCSRGLARVFYQDSRLSTHYSRLPVTARLCIQIPNLFSFRVCLFFAPIELAGLHLNHRPTSDLFLQSVFATNPREAAEVVMSVWWLCIIVLAIWIAYFILANRLDNRYILPPSKLLRYKRSVTAISSLIWYDVVQRVSTPS